MLSRVRNTRAIRYAALAALVVPTMAACVPASFTPVAKSGAPAAASESLAPQEIKMTVKEWTFTPAKLEFTAGRPVTLTLENKGNIEHDVVINDLGVKLVAGAGKSATTTFTPSKTGSFNFVCSLPGHKEAGMQGSASVVGVPTAGGAQTVSAPAPAAAAHGHDAQVSTEKAGNQLLPFRMDGTVKVFDVTAQHVQWEVLPGEFIDAFAYNGQVPGPVIRAKVGERIRINLKNELPEATVLHPHGPSIPNSMDGVPDVTQKVIEPGQSFSYEFDLKKPGMNMYHTHHNSAEQEPKGMYGLLIVDPQTPTVQYDKELLQVISETEGFFVINGKAFPATEAFEGKVGEKVLIRLVNMGQMPHPMHLHGHPFKIVATDGHEVPPAAQLTKDTVTLGPGERMDLLVELTEPGTWVFHCHILSHVQNKGVEPGGMITVIKVS